MAKASAPGGNKKTLVNVQKNYFWRPAAKVGSLKKTFIQEELKKELT